MKRVGRLILIIIGWVFAAAATAAAADLPPAYFKAPQPLVAPLWSGFYLGVNGGYGWNNEHESIVGLTPPDDGTRRTRFIGLGPLFVETGLVPSSLKTSANGGVFGGQLGYNWQIAAFVVGVEGDLQWSDIKGSDGRLLTTANLLGPLTASINTLGSQELNWYGTVRARAGYLATPNFLVFATGGVAFGGVNDNTSTEVSASVRARSLFDVIALRQNDSTRFGWTAGVGFEYLVARNWSVKTEYQFIDFGSRSDPFNTTLFRQPILFTVNNKDQFNIIKVGVNYHLN